MCLVRAPCGPRFHIFSHNYHLGAYACYLLIDPTPVAVAELPIIFLDQSMMSPSYANTERLPNEIFILVLKHASTLEILRCCQLSKAIRQLIDEDVSMRYRISLALCNMENGPPSSKSSAERLGVLCKYQEMWSTLNWSMDHSIDLRGMGGCWELHGNVFAMSTNGRCLEFHPLSGVLRDPHHHPSWKINVNFSFQDFTMDLAQDLLIVSRSPVLSDFGQSTIPIHILSMRTGEPHPDAISAEIILRASGNALRGNPRLRARGDFFAYLHMHSIYYTLQVWNWRTGEQYASFTHSQISSFTFYDDYHVLAGLQSSRGIDETPPAVEIWIFADGKGRPLDRGRTSNPCSRLGGLELPRLRSTSRYTRVKFSENSLSRRRSFCSHIPFHVSEDGRLFVINIDYTDPSKQARTAVLCIPRQTIQKHILYMLQTAHESKESPNIFWASWGPEGSRLFFDEETASSWSRNPYGSLLVTSHIDTSGEDTTGNILCTRVMITLRDFSRFATRPECVDQQNVPGTTPSWLENYPGSWTRYEEPEDVDAPSQHYRASGDISGTFLDNVSTRLPYQCISRALILPRSQGWFRKPSVMLAEDNILVLNDNNGRQISLLSF